MSVPSGSRSRRSGRIYAVLGALSAFGALAGLACSQSGGASSTGTAAEATSTSAAPATSEAPADRRQDDEARPLYPIDNSPPDALALRFCQAIIDTEAERHGACCGVPGSKGRFTGECARTLSAAMRSNAVTLDAAAVDKCAEAVSKDLDGCGWVGPSSPPLPAVCDGIFVGQLPERAVCRSSLECADSRTCQGLTATRTGRCVGPKPAGIACGGTVDTLAALTRQNRTEVTHPECAGYCARSICAEIVPAGGACKVSEECGADKACVSGKCSADPLPSAGKACADNRCAPGVRCINNKCVAAKAEGEACESDLECRGACEGGKCAKRCVALTIPTKPAFSVKSPPAPVPSKH